MKQWKANVETIIKSLWFLHDWIETITLTVYKWYLTPNTTAADRWSRVDTEEYPITIFTRVSLEQQQPVMLVKVEHTVLYILSIMWIPQNIETFN